MVGAHVSGQWGQLVKARGCGNLAEAPGQKSEWKRGRPASGALLHTVSIPVVTLVGAAVVVAVAKGDARRNAPAMQRGVGQEGQACDGS